MIWYPDIMLLLIWCFDFFVFHITSRICHCKVHLNRLVLASLFAAGMNIAWIYCYIKFHLSGLGAVRFLFTNLLIPLVTACISLMIVFGSIHVKGLLSKLLLLFIVSFCMGGLIIWLTGTLGIKNSLLVFFGGGAGYGLFLYLQQSVFLETKEQKTLYDVSFLTDKQRIMVKGFYDSGNHLIDPYMGSMVVIVSKGLKERLAKELGKQVLVPYYSLGNEHGMIMAYRCKEMIVWKENKEKACYQNILLAVDEQIFSHQQEYDVILHANMGVT